MHEYVCREKMCLFLLPLQILVASTYIPACARERLIHPSTLSAIAENVPACDYIFLNGANIFPSSNLSIILALMFLSCYWTECYNGKRVDVYS